MNINNGWIHDGYQRGHISMISEFFDKKTGDTKAGTGISENQGSAN